MAFTRSHYKVIAEILSEVRPDPNDEGQVRYWKLICKRFIKFFKFDNPKFDEDKFIIACFKD